MQVNEAPDFSRRRLTLLSLGLAVLTVALRWSFCHESLWVDELHSAWAVWDELALVSERSSAGNQTPWYFWGLWAWKQIFGGSEVALRAPSLLASAISVFAITWAAAVHSRQFVVGLLAGGLLAVEFRAVEFGTEVRVYALLIVLSILSARGWLTVLESSESSDAVETPWSLPWFRKVAMIWLPGFAAVLLHPTAALTVGMLAAVGGVLGITTQKRVRTAIYAAAGSIGFVLLALAVNGVAVRNVWSIRHQWAQFAIPRSGIELYRMWPWQLVIAAVLALIVVVVGCRVFCGNRAKTEGTKQPKSNAALLCLGTVLAATTLCWVVAFLEWLPMWHVRYLIGLLPLMMWGTADLWGIVFAKMNCTRMRFLTASMNGAIAVCLVGWLVHSQGTWWLWMPTKPNVPNVVLRGEDWRSAIAWLQDHRQANEPVYLGAELIESSLLTDGVEDASADRLKEYLLFPTSGPYAIDVKEPLGLAFLSMRSDLKRILAPSPQQGVKVRWLVYRMDEASVEQAYNQANLPDIASPAIARTNGATEAFGGVTIVRLETQAEE
ncbi:hypothetical protein FF011L_25410 [Roseimaritima multifibrata]|uniref:Glycosyltransferase RgtA/B/C/D-like domain-containing protein n=1 Tax=Roseimaritima multifibrata TaxID=1930274 RepID=A0A517MFV6_9BACT|nr:hypothetical protein FF011L_25410 [Roseimaritima multifibrata]